MFSSKSHYVQLAIIAHRRGMSRKQQGNMNAAFSAFVQRDIFIEKARGV